MDEDGSEAVAPLSAVRLTALMERVHHAFAAHRDEMDALNVFPVPDGDTGTNLVLTARSALDALAENGADGDVPTVLTRGALMGARGNSGVIFSQVLRAFADATEAAEADPAAGFVHALRRARELSYEAVADPLEGTMLTAIRVAAEVAERHQGSTPSLEELSAHVVAAVGDAVAHTREQLEANREADVVDAGARGFEVFVEALHDHLTGAAESDDEDEGHAPIVARSDRRRVERESGSSEYRYEVQYLLGASDEVAADLRTKLEQLGDSVVVVAADDVVKVHVHTNRIGEAIEAGVAFGSPSRIQVTEFADQIARDTAEAADAEAGGEAGPSGAAEGQAIAPVVVLPGPGLANLAEELHATVVEGRAGELPAVADLLNAISSARGETVVILPGHPNTVPTAHQASQVSVAEGGRELAVVDEADSPVAALAALAVCDPTGDRDHVLAEMRQAAVACRCGEVVAAVRDADTPVGTVRAGQWLAVVDGDVRAAADDPVDALDAAAQRLGLDEAEVVTLVFGAGVTDGERDRAVAVVEERMGAGAELDVIEGDQRPARYLLGVE